jgi:sulfhydrogenase subunit beta (sulfur reductase)
MSKPKDKNRWLISQEELNGWLDNMATTYRLLAPRQVAGMLLYRRVAGSDEIAWGASRPMSSIKEAFFPPTERLLTIEKVGGQIHLDETFPEGQQVIFGVRPCDVRGVKILDALFLDADPVDPYYARRRENTTLVGLACKEMGSTCFCTSVGGTPDDAGDMDLMLYEVEDGYMIQTVTEKGNSLIADLRLPIYDNEPKTSEANHRSPINDQQSPIPEPQSISWPERFNDEYWQKMSERCLSCRACAYVCPTCRCFAVRDEMIKPGEFERIRCWDACTGENYRRVAGGHKPRPKKGERLRNRFFCKFYYYPTQSGLGDTPACTGCGRCIDVCPVNVDITEVLVDLGRSA